MTDRFTTPKAEELSYERQTILDAIEESKGRILVLESRIDQEIMSLRPVNFVNDALAAGLMDELEKAKAWAETCEQPNDAVISHFGVNCTVADLDVQLDAVQARISFSLPHVSSISRSGPLYLFNEYEKEKLNWTVTQVFGERIGSWGGGLFLSFSVPIIASAGLIQCSKNYHADVFASRQSKYDKAVKPGGWS